MGLDCQRPFLSLLSDGGVKKLMRRWGFYFFFLGGGDEIRLRPPHRICSPTLSTSPTSLLSIFSPQPRHRQPLQWSLSTRDLDDKAAASCGVSIKCHPLNTSIKYHLICCLVDEMLLWRVLRSICP